MRTWLTLCLFCLAFLSFGRQWPKVTARTVCTYRVIYEKGKKIDSSLSKRSLLDPGNRVLSEAEFLDGKIQFRKEYQYTRGRLSSVVSVDEGGNKSRITYVYSKAGKISEEKMFEGSRLLSVTEYKYNSLNKITARVDYRISEGKKILNTTEVSKYNASNKLVLEFITNASGDTTYKGVYSYNDSAIIYKGYGADGKELESRVSHVFSDGRISKIIHYKGDMISNTEAFSYTAEKKLLKKQGIDDQGNLIWSEEYSYYTNGVVKKLVKDYLTEMRSETFNYDQKGNILKETYLEKESDQLIILHNFNCGK